MTILHETYTLTNGVSIPKLGLGTWFIDDDKAADAVRAAAAEIGYRNVDTAQGLSRAIDRLVVVGDPSVVELIGGREVVHRLMNGKIG